MDEGVHDAEPQSATPLVSTSDDLTGWELTRRQFLGGSAAMSLAAVVVPYDPELHDSAMAEQVSINEQAHSVVPIVPAEPHVHFSLDRATDLLCADITFYGFTLKKGATYPSLVATTTKTASNWIGAIVQLPPQALGEAHYWETSGVTFNPDPPPALSQLANPSILCYTLPQGFTIPLKTGNVTDLLDWTGWTLSVDPTADVTTGRSTPTKPAIYQTQIELPLFLILSPVIQSNPSLIKGYFTTLFESRSQPFTSHKAVTEVWSTKLVSNRVSRGAHGGVVSTPITPYISPVWSRDYIPLNGVAPNNLSSEDHIRYSLYVKIA